MELVRIRGLPTTPSDVEHKTKDVDARISSLARWWYLRSARSSWVVLTSSCRVAYGRKPSSGGD